jgi:carotenoid cleavage dioxygenase
MSQTQTFSTQLVGKAAGWISRQARERFPHSEKNPFLVGPFAPVATETTETGLKVTGKIPPELNGLYARIGPNPMQVANPATHHWFLGDGMVHGVRLREGKALWYRNRWIGSNAVNQRLGRPLAPGPRNRDLDTVNTNIIGHAGKLWALVEGSAVPVQLNDTLETERHSYFNTPLQRTFTAHPHRDPSTGDLHAICYDVLTLDQVNYVVIAPDGTLKQDIPIPVRHGPMIHDCALTETKMVVLDFPITFSMQALLRGHSFPYQWNEKHPARIGLLPRDGTAADISWFDIKPCFAFHTANAYDQPDGSVVLDLITYPKMFEGSRQGPDNTQSTFERFVLSPVANSIKRQTHSQFLQEFPRCDERLTGKPYRYAYTIGIDLEGRTAQPLYRHDMQTGQIATHSFGPHHMPAETIFVPRHPTSAEDDGYLITYVYDLAENTSTLTILDAGELGKAPVAIIHLPARVPIGFHGNWIADIA